MKKLLFFTAALLFIGSVSFAQSPKKSSEGDGVSITYGAPSKKDRAIFGGLVPYNTVWRTGANNATEITLESDSNIGGVDVKAGTYTLFTIPMEDADWTLILNPTLEQWGAFGYDGIKGADLPHIKMATSATSSSVEMMNISVDGGMLVISWDDTKASVAIN